MKRTPDETAERVSARALAGRQECASVPRLGFNATPSSMTSMPSCFAWSASHFGTGMGRSGVETSSSPW